MSIGRNMTLTVAGATIGKAKTVNYTVETKMADVTTRDSAGWSEFIPAMKSWTGEVDALFVSTNTGLRILMAAQENDTLIAVTFTDEEGNVKSGNAYVKSTKQGEPLEDGVTLATSLQGTGALSDSTPDS
jgi:hypothetical protein